MPQSLVFDRLTASLHYSLNSSCMVKISYFDLKGRLLATLINGRQRAGSYSIKLPAELRTSESLVQVFKAGDRAFKETVSMVR